MRISISNIAWDPIEDLSVAKLLKKKGVDAIDVAPGKYFPQPTQSSEEEVLAVRQWWLEHGIEIVGMQALLFGTSGLNLFGDETTRSAMLDHLTSICRIGGLLGAKKLVFGSPKNRDRTGIGETETLALAKSFFTRLGNIASQSGVVICLEPNPPVYGANFMVNANETAQILALVDHSHIKMQLDTGSILINGENLVDVVTAFKPSIGHVHLSEPNLVPLGEAGTNHQEFGQILQRALPNLIATIEMLPSKTEPHLVAIDRALTTALAHYQGASQ